MRTPVIAIDRAAFASQIAMTDAIQFYLSMGTIIQVEDTERSSRLCYEIRPSESMIHVFDDAGHQVGVFADVDESVDYAETLMTVTSDGR